MPRLGSWLLAVLLLASGPALAVQPDEVLPNAAAEARARHLSSQLRCMVCQNQSIDDSDASLARDLRILVRERIEAGDSDGQVLDYLVDRYGEFVLLKPRFSLGNLWLWGAPVVLLLIGGAAFAAYGRRSAAATPSDLSSDEEARLARLLGKGE